MKKYITKNELREKTIALSAGGVSVANSLNYLRTTKSQNSYKTSFDVFLSHSYLDRDTIAQIHKLLTDQGLSVYVDWIEDADLSRESVTVETAKTLRLRMKQCKSLIYCFSPNAKSSKWMPWELGYFDCGSKGAIMLFPILDYEHQDAGVEFISLYPAIELGQVLSTFGNARDLVVQGMYNLKFGLKEAANSSRELLFG